jgi:5'(3')-deoxyribonucleotidase
MKIKELMEDTTKKMPHLYLDMDGVQADFFGALAAKHNVENYKEIPDTEASINELASSSPLEVYKFFRELKPLQGGDKIVEWLHQHNIPYTVLSAPLRGPYAVASVEAKKDWLDEHNPNATKDAIFTQHKHKYALSNDEPNVLVDDYGKYLNLWTNAGGIAVKHEDNNTQHTISELEKIYAPYLNR